jgi:hypothetical protein
MGFSAFFSQIYRAIRDDYLVKYFVANIFVDVCMVFTEKGTQGLLSAFSEDSKAKAATLFLGKAKFLLSIPMQRVIPVLQYRFLDYQGYNKKHVLTKVLSLGVFLTFIVFGPLHLLGQSLHGEGGNVLSRVTGQSAYAVSPNTRFSHLQIILLFLRQNIEYLGNAVPTSEYVDKKYNWKMYQQFLTRTKGVFPFIFVQLNFEKTLLINLYIRSELCRRLVILLSRIYFYFFFEVAEENKLHPLAWGAFNYSKYFWELLHVTAIKGFISRFRLDFLIRLEKQQQTIGFKVSDYTPRARVRENHLGNISKYFLTDLFKKENSVAHSLYNIFWRSITKGVILSLIFFGGPVVLKMLLKNERIKFVLPSFFDLGITVILRVHTALSLIAINIDIAFIRTFSKIITKARFYVALIIPCLFILAGIKSPITRLTYTRFISSRLFWTVRVCVLYYYNVSAAQAPPRPTHPVR